MRTGAVVVAWHQPAITCGALASLVAMQPRPDHIVCVAQEFTAAERAEYQALAPAGVDTVFLDQNVGYPACVNLGMERTIEQGAEWVLLLNNDATVEPDCLAACLADAAANPKAAAVSPAIVLTDQPGLIWWAGGRLSRRWALTRHPGLETSVRQLPPSGDTEFIPGCCVLFSVAAWREIGPYPEHYFLYWEDANWCLRARDAAWRLRYLAKPLCRHAVGVSSGQRGNLGLSANTAYYLARNPLRAALDAEPASERMTRLLGHAVVWNGYNAIRIFRSPKRREVATAYVQGLRDAVRNDMGARFSIGAPAAAADSSDSSDSSDSPVAAAV